ncbi:O-antigen ligase family protein [Psychroflexus sp. MES1-P1E]|uniref:O-antigen ligase family protein n=1 Tax=Psychroflexus sp. MES1-P1E TaxID=2058320 RepID=UPI000C7BD690|nr:O-antigen ligase family protein [Psychroflexus sp. MES1-P1E]PKG42571.1 hypothetical protein CXF67_09565 [Psychroflexus sp. MES1-P1E]
MKNELFLNKIYLLLWVAFAFFLPFSKALPNLLLIPILILFLFLTKYKEIHFSWKNGFLFLIISVAWISVSMIIQGGVDETLKLILKFYFLIGIFFLSKSLNRNNFIILYGFIGGCIIQFLISAFSIIKFYLENGYIKLDIGGGVNEILHGERPYIGFTFALSILFSLFIIRKFKYQWLYIWVGLATGFLFYISARLATGMCILILIHHIYETFKKRKAFFFIISFVLASLITVGFFFNENFQKRMRLENDLGSTYEKFKVYEPRFIIWSCAIEVSHNMRPILGLGNLETIEKNLLNCYSSKIPNNRKNKLKYYQETAFNTHNQFLNFLLLGGWPACLLLILFFLVSFYRSNSILYTITLAMFLIFFIFENVLYRQLGIHLAGLLFGLLNTNLLAENKKFNT